MTEHVKDVDILIVGAGPTGLGAATRLHQLKHEDWLAIDRFHDAGGLARTHVTPEGFLFDVGGHVIFSHYEYFDKLLEKALGNFDDKSAWYTHQRESYVRYRGIWVPYPLQNNLCRIPPEDQVRVITGLVDAKVDEAKAGSERPSPANFDEFIVRTMGQGLAEIFMRPYNFKVWAVPPSEMQCSWLGERVALVDVNRAISNVLMQKEDKGWGPNAVFRFPAIGGTGAIWKAVASALPQDRILYRKELISVDLEARVAIILDVESNIRQSLRFNRMISTIPLDVLCDKVIDNNNEIEVLRQSARKLVHSSTYIIGLGFRGQHRLTSKCWLYFSEDNCPFYRATVFSNYSPNNVPSTETMLKTIRLAKQTSNDEDVSSEAKPGPYWSLMLEVSEHPRYKPVDMSTLINDCIKGCIATELCVAEDEIVSIHLIRFEHGYPVPSLERDEALGVLLPSLESKGVYSRGRFGSYKYEVANQDHSVALGVETVDAILFKQPEVTLYHPSTVNKPGKSSKPSWEAPVHRAPGQFAVGVDIFPTHVSVLKGKTFGSAEAYYRYISSIDFST